MSIEWKSNTRQQLIVFEISNCGRKNIHSNLVSCVSGDEIIESFLVTNKFNVEKTKEKLEMYYKIRTVLPDVFKDANPKNPEMKKIAESV